MNKLRNIINRIGNKIVRHTNWYNDSFWNGATKFWRFNQFGIDVMNLGSGAGYYAFNYDDVDVKGINCALSPQSLVHDYNILRNYFSYIRKGGFVVITVCPFSCLVSHYDKKHNLKYYTFLHPATIQDFKDDERTRALKIKMNPFNEMPVYCIKQTLIEFRNKAIRKVHPPKIALQHTANKLIEGWKRQFGIDDLAKPLSEKHTREQSSRRNTLDEMIYFCKERNLKPVVVIPPMHHTLFNQIPNEFYENYINRFLINLDAPVLDYSKSSEFDKDDYYLTALFLNKEGARLFTERVLTDIFKKSNS